MIWANMNWTAETGYNHISSQMIKVDAQGYMHLKIGQIRSKWYTAEILTDKKLGYGTYTWELGSSIALDKNAVLGLFTWDNDDPKNHNREIDIESALWGDAKRPTNLDFSVQPALVGTMAAKDPKIVAFKWQVNKVDFFVDGLLVATSKKSLPAPAQVDMNLWMFRNRPPQKEQEVIIKNFTFTPL